MSSSRAWGFSISSGMHFLFSGSDSSFSTSILRPLSSNPVKWVHLLVGSEAGESKGVWIKSKEVDPGLQLSSESTDKAVLRFWTLRLSGEQGPSWAKPSGLSQRPSLTWAVSHESSLVSWLRQSEKGLPVFVLVSISKAKERRCGSGYPRGCSRILGRATAPLTRHYYRLFTKLLRQVGPSGQTVQVPLQDVPAHLIVEGETELGMNLDRETTLLYLICRGNKQFLIMTFESFFTGHLLHTALQQTSLLSPSSTAANCEFVHLTFQTRTLVLFSISWMVSCIGMLKLCRMLPPNTSVSSGV